MSEKKVDKLLALLEKSRTDKTIVYCEDDSTVRELAEKLRDSDYHVTMICSVMTDQEQSCAVREFQAQKAGIVLASTVVRTEAVHVINFDFPWTIKTKTSEDQRSSTPSTPTDYARRVACAAGFRIQGKVVSLVTSGGNGISLLHEIEEFYDIAIEREE